MVEYMEDTYGRRAGGRGAWSAAGRRHARADRAHACERMSVDPRFVKLRRRFALQAGVLVSTFLVSYLSYLLLSAYARDFMGVQIIDSVNVALVLGIGQFLLAFVLAWAFSRFSEVMLDPIAEELREQARHEEATGGTAVRR